MSTERFGEFVRREREAREIGLREMAKMIGVSPTYLSKVERDAKDQFARITATPAAGVHQQTFLLVLQVEGQAPPVLPRTETEGGRRVGKGAKK